MTDTTTDPAVDSDDLDETEQVGETEDLDETEQAPPGETEDLMKLEQPPLGGTGDIAEAMEACVRARGFAQTIRNLVDHDRVEAAANIAGVVQQLDTAIACLSLIGGDPRLTRY